MSEDIDDVLTAAERAPVPLYLLVGEEFLVRKGADELVKKLLPDASAGLNLATLDGASPREVAEELATLPLFPGRKIVLVRDPEFLAPKKGRGDALSKAREAWKGGKRKEGARRLLALAARAGWGVEALGSPSPGQWKEELNVDLAEADVSFLAEVAAFCREEKLSAPEGDAAALTQLFEKGLPEGQILIVAASDVDARNPLVKLAGEKGCIIERRVASRLKDLDLSDVIGDVLKPLKKRLGPGAEERLKDRCGGNMRLLQSELEKLALYVEGATIEARDVEALVGRAREEEFMELSNALQNRDLRAALRYAQDAMEQGSHPLQLLGAIASIVRGLLENHERASKLSRGPFRMSFNDFKYELYPRIEEEAREAGKKPPHPYGIYMGMQAASRFGRAELLSALVGCAEADLALKSSGNGQLVIERLLWGVCGKVAA